MSKFIKTYEMRELERQVNDGEISYSRMIEILCEKAEEYRKEKLEEEIQARIEFKLGELMTGLENRKKSSWQAALESNHPKYSYYSEAFVQLKEMLAKEIRMATPYDDMAERKKRIKRDAAIDKIMEKFCKRGTKDYYHNQNVLVSIIENAQNF